MSDYTHLSKLSFDQLFARGPYGQETQVMDDEGNLTIGGLSISGTLTAPLYIGGTNSPDSDPSVLLSRTIANSSGNSRGFRDSSTFATATGDAAYANFDAAASTSGTANMHHIVGFQSRPNHNSSGTIQQLAGFSSIIGGSGGTAAEAWGFKSFAMQGTVSVTNFYGIYIADETKGTNAYGAYLNLASGANRYNLYCGGTAANYMAGTLTVAAVTGVTSPVFTASASGTAANYSMFQSGSALKIQGGSNGTDITATDGTIALHVSDTPVVELRAGSSSGTEVRPGGRMYITTGTATNTSTTETDLFSYDIPANTLSTNNDTIIVEAAGTYAANANSKTIRVKFGGSQIIGYGASFNGSSWYVRARIVRNGSSSQRTVGTFSWSDATTQAYSLVSSASISTSSSITVKVTGQGGASSDITCNYFSVDYMPNNS